jgi:hypothetical protein
MSVLGAEVFSVVEEIALCRAGRIIGPAYPTDDNGQGLGVHSERSANRKKRRGLKPGDWERLHSDSANPPPRIAPNPCQAFSGIVA